MTRLPAPAKPFGTWAGLVSACIEPTFKQGGTADPDVLAHLLTKELCPSIVSSFAPRERDSRVRPSDGVNCAARAYLARQGVLPVEGELDPYVFAAGHFSHFMLYAAIKSNLPDCFRARLEVEVDLVEELCWWPTEGWTTEKGHIDMVLEVTDPERAALYLEPDCGSRIVCDGKSHDTEKMYSTNEPLDPNEDPFGTVGQIATYSAHQQSLDAGALVIRIDRAVSRKHPRWRVDWIPPVVLRKAAKLVERRLGQARDFDPELFRRKQEGDIKWAPCEKFCKVRVACSEVRESLAV